MQGRARIGLVIPAVVVETLLTEFFHVVPPGVSAVITHLSIRILHDDEILRAASQREAAVLTLARQGVDCVAALGAPITRKLGVDSDRVFVEKLEKEAGIPVTTSQAAALDAFAALGVGRVAVASPYHADQDEETRNFLEARGIEVSAIEGMKTDVADIHNISLAAAYRHAKKTFFQDPTAEAIYVPCAQFTVPMIPILEQETGVPVITSAHATIWSGCRLAGVRDASFAQHGRLYSTLAGPRSA